MDPYELLQVAAAKLEALNIRYLVTGSMATISYGESRLTNDIDIVVELDYRRLPAFLESFPHPEYYLSEDAARDAIARRSMFNVIHPTSGLKLDFIVCKDSAFDRGLFNRGIRFEKGEIPNVVFTSPEDIIIKKLQFYQEGESDKHLRDISGVLDVQSGSLDWDYLRQWVVEFGLQELWEQVLSKSNLTPPE
jgi:hypothetical protein